MELPMTFADFAMSEIRFRKHFRTAPRDTWHDNMVLLADFLELPEEQRVGKYPFIWTVNAKQELGRLLVDETMVASCEDRKNFWTMLRAIAGVGDESESPQAIEEKIRREVMAKINAGLMQLLTGSADGAAVPVPSTQTASETKQEESEVAGEYMAPWIDSEECTACDECTLLNPNIFAYNDKKQATIKNPSGGPYRDLVKAAERCTAQIIHPGLPKDRSEKDIEQWIKRGEKYNL